MHAAWICARSARWCRDDLRIMRVGACRITDASMAVSAETNMRNDGSYAGVELGRGGVGAHAAAGGTDAFSVYRSQKSGRYHQIMSGKSTNPNRPAMGH